jgi:hypothetical protein
MAMICDAVVRTRWWFFDELFLDRHAKVFRVRSLYPQEAVALDHSRRVVPEKNSSVLKIVKRRENGHHVEQAFKFADKAAALAALSDDQMASAAFDLLDVGDADIRDVTALARARQFGRLQ